MEQPLVYLDSMVFIYAVEGDDSTAPAARELMAALRQQSGAALTSELSLAEVLAPATRNSHVSVQDQDKPLPFQLRQELYLDLMTTGSFLTLAPITREILLETAELRRSKPHKLPDAIHVVTAIRTGCRFLVSADRRIHAPHPITKLIPDNDGVAQLLRALG